MTLPPHLPLPPIDGDSLWSPAPTCTQRKLPFCRDFRCFSLPIAHGRPITDDGHLVHSSPCALLTAHLADLTTLTLVVRNRSVFRSFTTQVLPLPYPKEDFTGKTVLITGANTGLGLEAARHFVRLNASKVILGCRDVEKGEVAKSDIDSTQQKDSSSDVVEVWQVDLESFDSVKAFCRRAAALDRLDIAIENAGLLSHVYHVAEGYERLTTVNVISTWLMALLLLPVLRATKAKFYGSEPDGNGSQKSDSGGSIPHLIVVGSNAHFYTKFEGGRNEPSIFEFFRGGSDMFNRYSDTKLMSLFATREVAGVMLQSKDKPQIVLSMVEPGYCQSELLREKSWPWYFKALMAVGLSTIGRTSEVGSRTYLSAATAGLESHGVYLEDCKLSTPHAYVDSEEGGKMQKKVYLELMEILERVEPGISSNI